MTKSMTGYGKYSKSTEKYDISIEIKSVNSKYFDINFRLPKSVSALEITLRQPLQDIFIRGKIDVRIDINMHTITKYPSLNTDLVKVYREIFTKIAEEANIENKPKLDHFLRMPDVVDYINDDSMEEELEKIKSKTDENNLEIKNLNLIKIKVIDLHYFKVKKKTFLIFDIFSENDFIKILIFINQPYPENYLLQISFRFIQKHIRNPAFLQCFQIQFGSCRFLRIQMS